MSNTEQQPEQQETQPFLTEVIDFLRPKIIEERRNDMLTLAAKWVAGELRTYGAENSTDEITCTIELHKCRVNLPIGGKDTIVYGYQLLLIIQGEQPNHGERQIDCIFAVEDKNSDTIVNLYLPGDRPDGTPGDAVQ